MSDAIKATGEVTITIIKPSGQVIEETVKNLVVTIGKSHIANQMTTKSEGSMSHMAIGTGTTTQVAADAALQTELNRKALKSKVQGVSADANKITYTGEWLAGEGTGAITEAGIFNAASAGLLFARTTFSVKNKGAGDSLTIAWTVTITG